MGLSDRINPKQIISSPFPPSLPPQLRMLPGLEWVVRRVMTVLEEAVYLDNISSAILVGPTQMPSLHASLVEAADILDLPLLPELYIKQSPVPNAYCMVRPPSLPPSLPPSIPPCFFPCHCHHSQFPPSLPPSLPISRPSKADAPSS